MQVRRPGPERQQCFLNYILTSWTLKEEWPGHHTRLPLLPEHLPKTMIFLTNILSKLARSQSTNSIQNTSISTYSPHSQHIYRQAFDFYPKCCFHTTLVLQAEQLKSLKIHGDSTLLDVVLLWSLFGEGWAKGIALSHKWRWVGSFNMREDPEKSGQRMSGNSGILSISGQKASGNKGPRRRFLRRL